jgi:flagellar protein FliO/FliZ
MPVPIESDGLASLSLTIGLIVMLLWGAVWALRRLRPGAGVSAGDCAVIRALALGPRERLLVVRVGAKHLVIGVGAAGVCLLCELPEPLPPVSRSAVNTPFAAVIGKAVKSWRDA